MDVGEIFAVSKNLYQSFISKKSSFGWGEILISDSDADLSGVNINLPSSNSSAGAVDGAGKSLAEIALELDVPLDILVQANPTIGTETQLPDGTMVNIPGALTDPSFPDAYEVTLPEPVDTPNELEYID